MVRRTLALVVLLAWAPAPASEQALATSVSGEAVHVRAPGWSFLDGEPLARLKDGRTVRAEITVMAIAAPGRTPITTVKRVFSLSYDLWEERFAVAIAGARAAAISHLTEAAAEAWCVDQTSIPLASLAGIRDARYWIRLEGRILNGDDAGEPDDSGLTLQRIIDTLSRRKKNESAVRATEGGPFRLPTR